MLGCNDGRKYGSESAYHASAYGEVLVREEVDRMAREVNRDQRPGVFLQLATHDGCELGRCGSPA